VQDLISILRKGIVGIVCFLLAACSAPVSIVKPLDISRADQSATAQFVVRKSGEYRFALLFTQGSDLAEIDKRTQIWGDFNHEGVAVPVHLRVLKDGEEVFDEQLVTTGTQWGQTFDYEGQVLTTAVRLIKTLELSPGNYSIAVSTLDDLESFRNIESFVEVCYYKPKH